MCGGGGGVVQVVGLGGCGGVFASSGGWVLSRQWEVGIDGGGTIGV